MTCETCETCREMVILTCALWRKATYSASEVEDMINHIINGHTAESVISKFGLGRVI